MVLYFCFGSVNETTLMSLLERLLSLLSKLSNLYMHRCNAATCKGGVTKLATFIGGMRTGGFEQPNHGAFII
jgi:hypothetical protein